MKRTLTEIADTIYFETGAKITRKDISFVVNRCFQHISKELLNENSVMVTNFGKFRRTKHNSVSFKPALAIKNKIKKEVVHDS